MPPSEMHHLKIIEQPRTNVVQKRMSKKQDITEKDPAKQLNDFGQQPAKAKELELMEDHAEKSTGKERVATDQKIRAKTGHS